jgi:N-acyl-D-amino-acid deacylase
MAYNKLTRRDFLKDSGAAAASIFMSDGLLKCIRDPNVAPQEFDILIKNGLVIDGSGNQGFKGSVGVIGDTIAAIGDLKDAAGKTTIDASGQVIAPGFINIHSHTLEGIINLPGYSSIMQGITTELSGNCGGSQGPTDDGKNVGDYLNDMSKEKIGLNFATLVGHGTIRRLVIGEEGREPTSAELQKMIGLVEEAVQGGAFGISTGLEYTPGSFAKTPELIELSRVLKRYNLLYASHMRSEDNFLLEAVEEALAIGKEAGCPVQISHLKVQGEPNWNKIGAVFSAIEAASKERGNVHFDRYPYTAYSTGLANLFPVWSREGPNTRFKERLQDEKLAEKIKSYVIDKVKSLGSWHSIMITRARGEDSKYAGWRMDDIALDKKKEPYEVALTMMLTGGAGTVCFGMSEENTKRILAHPLCMICTDGSAQAIGPGTGHPRTFGSFPRVLGYYTHEQKIFDLPTAIHKMTAMPAEKLRLEKRGRIRRGCYADIVIFNPETIKDTATYEEPKQYPVGISHVLVNGQIAVKNGEHTGTLAGRVIRSQP